MRCGFLYLNLSTIWLRKQNVIVVVEGGNETIESVREWLLKDLQPLFRSEYGTFEFGGYIWYLQKAY